MRRKGASLALAALSGLLVVIGARAWAQPSSSSSPSQIPSSGAAATRATEARVAALALSLRALAALGAEAPRLEAELATASRQRCGSGERPPVLPCLLLLAQEVCASRPAAARASCVAAADVMLVNLRSANDWVDEATRVRLVRGAADYHRALLEELSARYAALAAELVLEESSLLAELALERAPASPPGAPSAPARASVPTVQPAVLDRFCSRRDHRIRPPRCNAPSATCVPSLSWQRCVAALAWFVTQEPAVVVPAPRSTSTVPADHSPAGAPP